MIKFPFIKLLSMGVLFFNIGCLAFAQIVIKNQGYQAGAPSPANTTSNVGSGVNTVDTFKYRSAQSNYQFNKLITAPKDKNPFVPVDETKLKSLQGGVHGGGGSANVAEFYMLARLIANAYQSEYSRTALGSKSMKLMDLYKKLKVEETEESLYIGRDYVEAINDPDQVSVKFNSLVWSMKNMTQKIQLVAHELLGLFRIPDPRTEVSAAIVLELEEQGIRISTDFAQLLRLSHPLPMKSVSCKVYRNYNRAVFKSFKLGVVAGGLGDRVYLSKNVFVEIYFGYGPRVQIRFDLMSKPKPNDDPIIIGHRIASAMVNFVGESRDFELETPEWQLWCEAQ